jgi:hypothetical protein
MPISTSSRSGPRSRRRTPSILFLLLAAFVSPSQAAAGLVTVGVSGSYEEMRSGSSTPDLLSISNDALSERAIVEILLDLTDSNSAVFDPSDAAFAVTSSDDVGFDGGVGFDLIADDVLRLVFTGFDPGETFTFGVDVDDRRKDTTGADFEGSPLQATFGVGVDPLIAVFLADPSDSDRAVAAAEHQFLLNPEPSTALLLAAGLVTMAIRRSRKD